MRIETGVDLTYIARIAELARHEQFLRRAFNSCELDDPRPSHLAGLFAAKEAVFKALGRTLPWKSVAVIPNQRGRPTIYLDPAIAPPGLARIAVSISHEADYAIAVAVALFQPESGIG
ncbi:MAG: holo-ACP synthase [Chloroflexi bacterium]|nr:holo-ACP synthase [Chloroflexota bacterium]